MLAYECRNPIFGGTTNPYSTERTCGGSSGGEAALVALSGTPLGWGNDGEFSLPPRETCLTISRGKLTHTVALLRDIRSQAGSRAMAFPRLPRFSPRFRGCKSRSKRCVVRPS